MASVNSDEKEEEQIEIKRIRTQINKIVTLNCKLKEERIQNEQLKTKLQSVELKLQQQMKQFQNCEKNAELKNETIPWRNSNTIFSLLSNMFAPNLESNANCADIDYYFDQVEQQQMVFAREVSMHDVLKQKDAKTREVINKKQKMLDFMQMLMKQHAQTYEEITTIDIDDWTTNHWMVLLIGYTINYSSGAPVNFSEIDMTHRYINNIIRKNPFKTFLFLDPKKLVQNIREHFNYKIKTWVSLQKNIGRVKQAVECKIIKHKHEFFTTYWPLCPTKQLAKEIDEKEGTKSDKKLKLVKYEFDYVERLDYALRHGAVNLGIKVSPDGFMVLDDILALDDFVNVTSAQIIRVAKSEYTTAYKDGKLCVKANFGHSMNVVQSDALLERRKLKNTTISVGLARHIGMVCYPTDLRLWQERKDNIQCNGIIKGSNNNIELIPSCVCESNGVPPSLMGDVEVLVYIYLEQMVIDGICCYQYSKKLVLSEGYNGVIAPKYFKKAVRHNKGSIGEVIYCNYNDRYKIKNNINTKTELTNVARIMANKYNEENGTNINEKVILMETCIQKGVDGQRKTTVALSFRYAYPALETFYWIEPNSWEVGSKLKQKCADMVWQQYLQYINK